MREAPAAPRGAAATLARWRVPLGFLFGALVLWLARPTWTSLTAGAAVALGGEALRVWAAGHLEKSREVTRSGPYRWLRHPLYVGSTVMAAGLAMAAARPAVAILIAGYLAVTLTAAIRTEEAFLRARFGGDYEAYRRGAGAQARRFSLERALVTNREHRALVGLAIAFALLVVRMRW